MFDIDKHAELKEMLGVQSIPHLFTVHNGELLDQMVGRPDNKEEGIKELIEKSVKQAKESGNQD